MLSTQTQMSKFLKYARAKLPKLYGQICLFKVLYIKTFVIFQLNITRIINNLCKLCTRQVAKTLWAYMFI